MIITAMFILVNIRGNISVQQKIGLVNYGLSCYEIPYSMSVMYFKNILGHEKTLVIYNI